MQNNKKQFTRSLLGMFVISLLSVSLEAQTWISTPLPTDFIAQEITNGGLVEGIRNNQSQIYSKETYTTLYSGNSPILGMITKTTKSGFRLIDSLNIVDNQRRSLFVPDYPNALTGTLTNLDFLAEDVNDLGDVVGEDISSNYQSVWKELDKPRIPIPFPDITLNLNSSEVVDSIMTYAINDKKEIYGIAKMIDLEHPELGVKAGGYTFVSKKQDEIQNSTQLITYEWMTNRDRPVTMFPLAASTSGSLAGFVDTLYGTDAVLTDPFGGSSSHRSDSLRDVGVFTDINSSDVAVGGVSNVNSAQFEGGYVYDGGIMVKDSQTHLLNFYNKFGGYINPALPTGDWIGGITSVNDCGEIIVPSGHDNTSRYYLLSPPDIGYVFAPDPITNTADPRMTPGLLDMDIEAQRTCVKLPLDNEEGRLTTEYVAENSLMNDEHRHYDYTWDSVQGQYVNALYYTDLAARYMRDTLGFYSL